MKRLIISSTPKAGNKVCLTEVWDLLDRDIQSRLLETVAADFDEEKVETDIDRISKMVYEGVVIPYFNVAENCVEYELKGGNDESKDAKI